MRTLLRSSLVLFLVAAAIGCADSEPSAPPALMAAGIATDSDPALREIVDIVVDYRTRALEAGLTGDEARQLHRTGDPQALSRRIGYSAEEIHSRDARMRAAVTDLLARQGRGSEPAPTPCVPCGDEVIEGFAAWLDSAPSSEFARMVMYCEVESLVGDVVRCVRTQSFGSDGFYGCIRIAICSNCYGVC